jgi:pyrrolysine biosynthesis protein PylC
VEVFPDPKALERRFGSHVPAGWVLQEYLEGPSFSIEIIGRPGAYTTLQVTDLEMAPNHDCKRVSAPSTLPLELVQELERMALAVAEELNLSGIMDLEVVLHEGRLKVLEIDARFPSQTPAVVYHSTGINMVERLVGTFFTRNPAVSRPGGSQAIRGAVLEHIRCAQGRLSVGGEGMMADAGPLHLEEDFFGADEALTSHGPERDDWVATLMVKGEDLPAAGKRRDRVVEEIRDRLGLKGYSDEYPDGPLGEAR